jgi:hypothetical protein
MTRIEQGGYSGSGAEPDQILVTLFVLLRFQLPVP